MKMKTALLARTALPLLTVSLLASCMSIPIESWTDPAVKDRDMGTVLIMGIGDSESTQRQYEALFVETLAAEGITATPGYAVVNNDKPLKKSQIVAKVKELGIDSVIVTRKTVGGRAVKALERPGLWNGAMAGWNTVFVEVPDHMFNPVKRLQDLLKPSHRV